MLKVIKISILLLFFANIVACSYSPESLKELYNDLPAELSNELKDAFHPSAEQSAMIDDYTQQLMQWHRRNKLPQYSQNLMRLAVIVQQDNISLPQLQTVFKYIEEMPHFKQATHLTYKMLAVAKSLTRTQITQLEKSLKKEHQLKFLEIKNENYKDEASDGIKFMFKFIGISLSPDIIEIIKEESKKLHDTRSYELLAEEQWSNQLITQLKQSQSEPYNIADFDSRFVQLWNSQGVNLTGKGRQLEQQNSVTMLHLFRKLIMNFEPEQKERLSRQLTSMSNTLSAMANE